MGFAANAFNNDAFEVEIPTPVRPTGPHVSSPGLSGGGFTMFPLHIMPPKPDPDAPQPVDQSELLQATAARLAAAMQDKQLASARMAAYAKDSPTKGDIAAAEMGALLADDEEGFT